jgi:hypothetical protein
MNTTTSRRLVRLLARPVAVAGIIGGAIGLAAAANASTAPARPIVYPHAVQAQPMQPIAARQHAVQTPVSNDVLSRARAVEAAPWPPSHQAPLLGAPGQQDAQ